MSFERSSSQSDAGYRRLPAFPDPAFLTKNKPNDNVVEKPKPFELEKDPEEEKAIAEARAALAASSTRRKLPSTFKAMSPSNQRTRKPKPERIKVPRQKKEKPVTEKGAKRGRKKKVDERAVDDNGGNVAGPTTNRNANKKKSNSKHNNLDSPNTKRIRIYDIHVDGEGNEVRRARPFLFALSHRSSN